MKRPVVLLILGVLGVIIGAQLVFLNFTLQEKTLLKKRLSKSLSDKYALQARLNAAKPDLELLRRSLDKKQQQISRQQDKIKNLNGQLAESKKEIKELCRQYDEIAEKFQTTSAELSELKNSAGKLTPKNGPPRRTVKRLRELKKKYNSLVKKHRILEEINQSLRVENDELKDREIQFTRILAKKELRLNSLDEKNTGLKSELSEIKEQHSELKSRMNLLETEQENASKFLGEVTYLNSVLGDVLGKFSGSLKEKAEAEELKQKVEDELKKKIEIILMPEEEYYEPD